MNHQMNPSCVVLVLLVLATLSCGEKNPTGPSSVRWVPQHSGTTQRLYSVDFINTSTGYAVGQNGTILKTTDGGTTWTAQPAGTDFYDLTSVYFLNESTGYVVGHALGLNTFSGIILQTTDGGSRWMLQAASVAPFLDFSGAPYSIRFLDVNTGVAVGCFCGFGAHDAVIFKTIDGGRNWTAQYFGATDVFYSVVFPTPTIGYVVGGQGIILKTTDGGTHWAAQASGTTRGLRSAYFLDATTGYIVGTGGTILKTTDGGISWQIQVSEITQTLHAVYFSDVALGYAVGDSGTVLYTSDGGTTWRTQTSGTMQTLRSVDFPDVRTGYIVGEGGTILKTTS